MSLFLPWAHERFIGKAMMQSTIRSKIPGFANFPNCDLPELKIFKNYF